MPNNYKSPTEATRTAGVEDVLYAVFMASWPARYAPDDPDCDGDTDPQVLCGIVADSFEQGAQILSEKLGLNLTRCVAQPEPWEVVRYQLWTGEESEFRRGETMTGYELRQVDL